MLDAFAGIGRCFWPKWHRSISAGAPRPRNSTNWTARLRKSFAWPICGRFQRKEIEAVAPTPAEDVQLEHERRVLRNVVHLEETASAAYAALYDAPESVTAQLRVVVRRLEELTRIDETMADVLVTLQPAAIAVDEAAHALRQLSREAGSRSGTAG